MITPPGLTSASWALQSSSGAHHIPEVDGADWYSDDEHLQWLVGRSVGESLWPVAETAMREAGTLVPERIEPLMPVIEQNGPVLRQFDHRGQRVDEVDYHPLLQGGRTHRARLRPGADGQHPRLAWDPGIAPAALHAGVEYLFLQADQPICSCPVGMAAAMCRTLRRNDPVLAARWVPRIASDDPDNYLTAAMFMTETAGGSDLGASECTAVRQHDGSWRLYGEKWFCSNPTADLVLIRARREGAGSGTRGLGLFLMPRMLPDSVEDNPGNADPRRNAYILHRLKSKFGQPAGSVRLAGPPRSRRRWRSPRPWSAPTPATPRPTACCASSRRCSRATRRSGPGSWPPRRWRSAAATATSRTGPTAACCAMSTRTRSGRGLATSSRWMCSEPSLRAPPMPTSTRWIA